MADQSDNPLGKIVAYPRNYDPGILHSIARASGREPEGIDCEKLPFFGADKWTCYELSWLDQSGKPNVGVAEIVVPCDSPNLVESKSLKLYLNSINEHRFNSIDALRETIATDIQKICGAKIIIDIFSINQYAQKGLHLLAGICLDDLVLLGVHPEPDPRILSISDSHMVKDEGLYSHLLKSNCPMTGQPDWASVQISYRGRAINHQSLLAYLISFRHHQGFHEQCVEKIFTDINRQCKPEKLTIIARYTRRGGLDINPWRSTERIVPPSLRLGRQ